MGNFLLETSGWCFFLRTAGDHKDEFCMTSFCHPTPFFYQFTRVTKGNQGL